MNWKDLLTIADFFELNSLRNFVFVLCCGFILVAIVVNVCCVKMGGNNYLPCIIYELIG